MLKFRHIILNAFLATTLFFVMGASAAFAANLTVTNTDPAATVGTNMPNFSITIDVQTAANIINTETVIITVPNNFPQVFVDNASANDNLADSKLGATVTVGGHVVCDGDDGMICSAAGRALTITFADVTNMDGAANALTDGDDIVVAFTTAADTAGTASSIYGGGWTIVAGDITGTHGETVVVTGVTEMLTNPAAAGAVAALGTNSVAGTAGDTTITVNLPVVMANGDTIAFTMPSNMDVSAVIATAATGTLKGSSNLPCTAVGQVITCTIDGASVAAGAGKTVILGNITSKYAATGQSVTSVAITDTGNGQTATTASAALTETTAGAANASIALSAATVGATTTMTLTATPTVAMAVDDTIVWTMPAWVSVTQGAITVDSETFGGAGTFGCTGVSATRVITCTATGAINATEGTIVMSGMLTNYVATGTNAITDLAMNDNSASNADISADTTVSVTTTTVGVLSSTNVTPASSTISTYSSNTIAFTNTVNIPASGRIIIVYPSGWDVSNANGQGPSSCSGMTCANWTTSVSGQTITLTENGTGATTAGAISFVLNDIMTAGTAGSGGTYSITTATASANQQTDAAVTADTLSGKTTTSSVDVDEPTSVSVTDASDGNGVVITWNDPSGDDSDYIQILRGIDPYPVNGTPIAVVAIGTETYADTDVEAGDVVTYQLRGKGGGEYGDLTDEVTYTVGSGLTVTTDDDDTADDTDATDDDDATDDADATDDDDATDDAADDDASAADDDDDDTTDATELTDVSGHWAEDSITVLVDAGIIKGDPGGTFRPDSSLNRAEAATLLYRELGLGDPSTPGEDPFSDVDMDAWYAGYIAVLLDLDLVSGNPDGTYEPSENINRAEFLQLAMNIYEYSIGNVTDVDFVTGYADLDLTAWYAQTVSNATDARFVGGSSCSGGICFNAGSEITRAEAVTILSRMFHGGTLADVLEDAVVDSGDDATTGDDDDDATDTSTMSEADAIEALTVTLQTYGDISVYNGSERSVDLLGYYITDEQGFEYTFSSELGTGESIDIDPEGGLTADDGSLEGYITLTLYDPYGNFVFSINEDL